MKLQLALDGTLEDGLAVLRNVRSHIDLVEVGTPLLIREGVHAVRRVRDEFADLTILADLKIMDAGKHEADIAFNAGANIVTVLGLTHDTTLQGVIEAAQFYHQQVMVDLIQVANLVERSREVLAMGADYVCVHTAHDRKSAGDSPLATLAHLREALPDAQLCIAGGIDLNMIEAVVALQPAIIVVGGAITRAYNPAEAARQLHERIHAR
ncbi:MAG: 3-hexulose-6-phosphate synthase [Chloroflexi bacterium]|nr:MAG: 3-hexulose-6-phosphate synthase [Chloroflexota bacterium]